MKQYLRLLNDVLRMGELRDDRTGVGTRGIFGAQLYFEDIDKRFPLVTTKKVNWEVLADELLWMLKGKTNISSLNSNLWTPWADELGELGPVYGKQWKDFGGVDQLAEVIENIKFDPYSRRHVVSAWNPPELDYMALPPCPALFQFYVSGHRLSCHVYQRSADLFLGVPFDIAEYALLTHLVAKTTNLVPSTLIFSYGDAHIYNNHIEQVKTQLERVPLELPALTVKLAKPIREYTIDDLDLVGYNHEPALSGRVAV